MNAVFADIDGVLNTFGDKELICNTFEVKKLNNLVNLIKTTGSLLVIISQRRFYEVERKNIDSVFNERGIDVNYLSCERLEKRRVEYILDYLTEHDEITNFVIIDDNDFGYSQNSKLSSHYINTYENGFDQDSYNKSFSILKRE